MAILIVWERPDGGISTRYPAYHSQGRPPGDSDSAFRSRCIARDAIYLTEKYGVCVPHECDDSKLPPDDYLFPAWRWGGRSVLVDMARARVIHMNRIRVVRDRELERESGSKYRQPPELESLFSPARLARLQELRDIPQDFDLMVYDSPAALRAAWPATLPAEVKPEE